MAEVVGPMFVLALACTPRPQDDGTSATGSTSTASAETTAASSVSTSVGETGTSSSDSSSSSSDSGADTGPSGSCPESSMPGEVLWHQWIAPDPYANAQAMRVLEPDRIAIAGGESGDDSDLFVRVLDIDGQVAWEDGESSPFEDYAVDLAVDEGGNLVVAGYDSVFEGYDENDSLLVDRIVWLRKYTPEGVLLWALDFPHMEPENEHASGVEIDEDGSIVVVADRGVEIPSLRRVSPDGVEVAPVTYLAVGTSPSPTVRQFSFAQDGDLMLVGGGLERWAARVSPSGQLGWTRTWDDESSAFEEIVRTPSDTFAVSARHVNEGAWVGHIDGDGNVLWEGGWGPPDLPAIGYGVAVDPDGNIVIVGATGEAGAVQVSIARAHKYRSDGTLVWETDLEDVGPASLYRVDIGPDCGVFVMGFSVGDAPGEKQTLLAQLAP